MSKDVIKAVLYTDGGLSSNEYESYAGCGVHGYVFNDNKPKRGTGNPKAKLLNVGYQGPKDNKGEMFEGEQVTPIKYVDIVKSIRGCKSSGEVELNAMDLALKWVATQDDVKDVKVYSDSKYVVLGLTKHLDGWAKNDWVTKSGTKVKNVSVWQAVKATYDELTKDREVLVDWVKGHNGNFGNERADDLATKGKLRARIDKEPFYFEKESEVEGYFLRANTAPPILMEPRWYFDTADILPKDDEGNHIVYCGSHGTKDKETELLGKPYSDNYLGVVKIKALPTIMEDIAEYTRLVDISKQGKVVVGHLDTILSKREGEEYTKFGLDFHKKSKREIRIVNSNGLPLITEMNPQGQGYRMIDVWRLLRKRLDSVVNKGDEVTLTDITDILYEPTGKQEKLKLKAKWTQREKYFDVHASFNLEKRKDTPKPFDSKIRLILGRDILTRNQLAALGPDVKCVYVVTWKESSKVGRYATYIELTNGDRGIWSRYEANYILHSK